MIIKIVTWGIVSTLALIGYAWIGLVIWHHGGAFG
jgi:hypothetical protein